MNSKHFTLHEVVTGVWAAEADLAGASVGNATIIDAGGKTIIVDTFMTEVAAQELRRVSEELTGNQVYLAVNSHWHADHTSGNQVFADVPIVSTRQTMERLIEEMAPHGLAAWQEEIETSIASLQDSADDDERAVKQLEQLRHFKNSAEIFELTLPDLLIDRRLVVEGERRVEIETRGKGHTVSDTVVWLPEERLMITGDLCWNGIHPRMHDGFPGAWAKYVEEILDLEPLHVIPGHGRPGDVEALSDLPEYFRTVEVLIDEVRAGADPKEIPAPAVSISWDGLGRMQAGLQALADR
jgi:glyoxylase-like metal-dependent hydrolase (beta-lactamase superfamily II)